MKKKEEKNSGYAPEFRVHACRLVIDEKLSQTKVAIDLGIPPKTLFGWVKKFRDGQWDLKSGEPRKVEEKGSHLVRTKETLSSERREVLELQKQVRRLTMEREILKKAMAYCVDLPK